MLVRQAIEEGVPITTKDEPIAGYAVQTIW
jgi:PIN domain nuclease of toxin-antitoxin system